MLKRYLLICFSLTALFLLISCSGPQSLDATSNHPSHSDSLLKVHYIDVGQADATLLHYHGSDEDITILIDAGNWNGIEVVEYLEKQNITDIDLAVGTHPDADHIGQLDKVIQSFHVGEVWLSGNTSSSQTFLNLLKSIQQNNIDYYEPRMGEDFELGPIEIVVLYPKSISEKDNEESISLKITFGDRRFIFTGDASRNDELTMIQNGLDLQADFIHLGHHGSITSTHPDFLKKVQPEVAIYSAGKGNSYGHPHPEVVQLVKQQGIKLLGTDTHGTIIIETDGSHYNILTNKEKEQHPTADTTNDNDSIETSIPSSQLIDCININTASFEQLQNIIHIGPERAQEIIQLRPFTSIDDLEKISGIGPGRMKDIKSQSHACVGGSS